MLGGLNNIMMCKAKMSKVTTIIIELLLHFPSSELVNTYFLGHLLEPDLGCTQTSVEFVSYILVISSEKSHSVDNWGLS